MSAGRILAEFPKLSALVAGDICLDRWCAYDPAAAEPSRETGIPRIGVVGTEVTPGAGGTIANNLRALGVGRVATLGVAGEDGFGHELICALEARGISAEWMIRAAGLQTFTYTKLINGETGREDLARVDFIVNRPLARELESQAIRRLREAAAEFDIVLVSDQAETNAGGVVTAAVRQALGELAAAEPRRIVWVDSRMRTEHFRNVILKPNRDEADAACRRAFGTADYSRLRRQTKAPLLIVTQGPDGALLVDDGGEQVVRTRPVANPVDICGAGDSFSAGACAALAVSHDAREAVRFGNLVASITIMKPGTGIATPEEILAAERDWEQ
ncbi:MAG: ribokinase [Acidobacteria bacterium]|nr:ribokinase [Acidobacteriota bacterium]